MPLSALGIRWRLVALIVAMIVPIALLIYSNVLAERDQMIAAAEEEVLSQANLVSSAHDQLLETVERLLTQLSRDPVLRDFEAAGCSDVARQVTAAHPAYSNIAISNLEGIVKCSANPQGIDSLVADRPYYQDALATGGISTSGYLYGRISHKPVDVFAMPLWDEDDRVIGVVELSVDLAWLSRLIESQDLRMDVQTTVLGTDGMVLVRVPADSVTTGSNLGDLPWVQDVLATHSVRRTDLREPDKPVALSAIVPLQALSGLVPGYVVVTTPREVALAAAERTFRRGILAVGAVGIIGIAWAWSISTLSVHRPVRALLNAARAYGRGEFGSRVGLARTSSGELTELADAFESMADAVSASQEVLRRNATIDQLTGLPNRAEFTRLANLRLNMVPERRQALLSLQLREFSAVNATFGFEGGNVLLQQLGPRLQQTFGDETLLGRTDGDEFTALIAIPSDDTTDVERMVSEAFDIPFALDGESVYLAVHAGIARYPRDAGTAVALARRANLAQRRAKLLGRNVVEYAPERDEPRTDQIKLLSALRAAVEAGELELHYQPKVDLQRNEVIGAEALMRWRLAEGGYVPPGDFIVLAEQAGFIRTLSAWALVEACRQVRAWHDAGLPLAVGLNLSAADFEDLELAERLRALRDQWSLPSGALDIEITESALMSNPAEAARICEALREHGFTIAIDDFGTGYSPLVYLQRLPVTSIKVDRTFIREITTSQRSHDIVDNTLALGRRIGLVTVAEGIETLETAELLRAMGCQIGQGYYFGRPMPADQFTAWLTDNALGLAIPTRLHAATG